MSDKRDRKRTFTGKCVVLYPHLVVKDKFSNKHKADFLFEPDSQEAKRLKEESLALAKTFFGSTDGVQIGIKKADSEKATKYPAYTDKVYLTAKSDFPVECFDHKNTPMDAGHVRSGNYVNASITLKATEVTGKKYITVYINKVQKLGEGEDLGLSSGSPFEATEEIVSEASSFDSMPDFESSSDGW